MLIWNVILFSYILFSESSFLWFTVQNNPVFSLILGLGATLQLRSWVSFSYRQPTVNTLQPKDLNSKQVELLSNAYVTKPYFLTTQTVNTRLGQSKAFLTVVGAHDLDLWSHKLPNLYNSECCVHKLYCYMHKHRQLLTSSTSAN